MVMNNDSSVSKRLPGRVAIVTGVGSGIGRAIAKQFLSEGAVVFAIDKNADGLDATAGENEKHRSRFHKFEADICIAGQSAGLISACCENCGKPDILVNNAGIGGAQPFMDVTDDDIGRFLDVNVRALMSLSREFLGGHSGNEPSIVNITSVFGLTGMAGYGAYSASKAAIVGITRQMAAEFGPDGVRVNAVAPGVILTPLTETKLKNDKCYRLAMIGGTPLGRAGTADEIAKVVAFLASSDASYVSGHTLVADGGWSASRFKSPLS